jgi:hypothetical protein
VIPGFSIFTAAVLGKKNMDSVPAGLHTGSEDI